MRLSFCITCKNRARQLKFTLPRNLALNREPSVEFVICDYSSEDDLMFWLFSRHYEELRTGRIRYVSIQGQRFFRMAHAKNCAHRAARGAVLCNLDADNYTGPHFDKWLLRSFATGTRMAMSLAGLGTNGRLALTRPLFNELGGYDESFDGYGWDDNDLRDRAKAAGVLPVIIPRRFLQCRHDDGDRGRWFSNRDILKTNEANRLRSEANIRAGRLVFYPT